MIKLPAQTTRSICPISNSLDIVGDRWTLLVIRDMLIFGKHEYHEFMHADEGISTNILAERLKRLLTAEIVKVRAHPTNKTRKLYYLTAKGKALLPLMLEMAFWGGQYLEASKPAREKVREAQSNPKDFKAKLLANLKTWEKEYLK